MCTFLHIFTFTMRLSICLEVQSFSLFNVTLFTVSKYFFVVVFCHWFYIHICVPSGSAHLGVSMTDLLSA